MARIALLTSRTGFLLVAMSDHTTGSRNIKPEVVFKVQKMARYASFCLIMGPFKRETACFCQIIACSATVACAKTPSHSRGPGNGRVRVSFTTGAVWSTILATAWLLVFLRHCHFHMTVLFSQSYSSQHRYHRHNNSTSYRHHVYSPAIC